MVDSNIEAAQWLCDEGRWDLALMTGRMTLLESVMGIRYWREGTREQIVIALCFLAAMHSRE